MEIKPIKYGAVPNVLLIGNGINRLFGENSWDRVMELISTGEYDHDEVSFSTIKSIPNSLQTIIISSGSVGEGMCKLAEEMMPKDIKPEHAGLLKEYAGLPFDTILTTNYSYEIETALEAGFFLKRKSRSKYRKTTVKGNGPQNQFELFKYMSVGDKTVWHIHGEAAKPDSMVMGHYYYGKLLTEIQKSIYGIIRKYKACQNSSADYIPNSWIDYFLLGNVYIVGFGLDPSEMDIWWLINCKKIHFGDVGKIYFYQPNLYLKQNYPSKVLADIFEMKYRDYQVKKVVIKNSITIC